MEGFTPYSHGHNMVTADVFILARCSPLCLPESAFRPACYPLWGGWRALCTAGVEALCATHPPTNRIAGQGAIYKVSAVVATPQHRFSPIIFVLCRVHSNPHPAVRPYLQCTTSSRSSCPAVGNAPSKHRQRGTIVECRIVLGSRAWRHPLAHACRLPGPADYKNRAQFFEKGTCKEHGT